MSNLIQNLWIAFFTLLLAVGCGSAPSKSGGGGSGGGGAPKINKNNAPNNPHEQALNREDLRSEVERALQESLLNQNRAVGEFDDPNAFNPLDVDEFGNPAVPFFGGGNGTGPDVFRDDFVAGDGDNVSNPAVGAGGDVGGVGINRGLTGLPGVPPPVASPTPALSLGSGRGIGVRVRGTHGR